MAGNFPDLTKGINLQIQEAELIPSRINLNKYKQKHIIIGLVKTKNQGKNLENRQNKSCIIQMTADFSSEIMKARRTRHHIFQVLKEKKEVSSHEFLHMVKMYCGNKEEIKAFSDEWK